MFHSFVWVKKQTIINIKVGSSADDSEIICAMIYWTTLKIKSKHREHRKLFMLGNIANLFKIEMRKILMEYTFNIHMFNNSHAICTNQPWRSNPSKWIKKIIEQPLFDQNHQLIGEVFLYFTNYFLCEMLLKSITHEHKKKVCCE